MNEYRRTIRTIKLVVETNASTDSEHAKQVFWAEKNMIDANRQALSAFITSIVYDEDGKVVRFGGNGVSPSPETGEIISELAGFEEQSG